LPKLHSRSVQLLAKKGHCIRFEFLGLEWALHGIGAGRHCQWRVEAAQELGVCRKESKS